MTGLAHWQRLNHRIVSCERCPKLIEHCRQVAAQKRRAYQEWSNWGRPVPNFGDHKARVLIVGLAPAAHGGNRTGRVFTGDRSGEWLFRALFKAGFANQSTSERAGDGLTLFDCAITAACHCAPPANKPTPGELAACQPWFEQTVDILPVRVFIALGQIAWRSTVEELRRRGWLAGPMPRFGHCRIAALEGGRWLVGSYHPSQQNTFTGRLTEAMFDEVFAIARRQLTAPRRQSPAKTGRAAGRGLSDKE